MSDTATDPRLGTHTYARLHTPIRRPAFAGAGEQEHPAVARRAGAGRRGERPRRNRRCIPRGRRWLALLAGLLVLNLVLAFTSGGPPDRQQVPYQPFFVEQLRAGNVESISSPRTPSTVTSSAGAL